ncbi:YtxH domain-containing protein [Acidithiobacillus sp.]|uniref:YtxH domain-containing protein n=1 Tax=Acidithiobacillus sp. TaxID=1872118 RepID=UPI0025C2FBEE|nr:YtxH domain-containing protein [Acidithiobacillus sp.]
MRNAEGFILGVVVGAVGALLLAPASGAETRGELRRALERGREQLEDLQEAAEERIGALLEEIQEKTSQLMDAGGDLVEAKRQDLQEAIRVAKRALAEEREILLRSSRQRRMAELDGGRDD